MILSKIVIVDYGMGNLGSVLNMFKYLGYDATVTYEKDKIKEAGKIILAGVGSFDHAMQNLSDLNIIYILKKKVLIDKIPILGICLGMQIFGNSSEEGDLPGLGWIDADVVRFNASDIKFKVPHMGWNVVECSSPSRLTDGVTDETRFYFVHSYYVRVDHEQNSILKSWHGVHFDAAIQHKNILGVQFHPEKSHRFGMKLLGNFSKL